MPDERLLLTRSPITLVGRTVSLANEPASRAASFVTLAHDPVKLATHPVSLADEPASLATSCVTLAHDPVKLATHPVSLADEPASLATSCVKLAHDPVKLATRPVMLAHEPASLATSCVTLAHDPDKLATRRVTLAHQPASLATSSVTLADDPAMLARHPSTLTLDPAGLTGSPVSQAASRARVAPDPANLACFRAHETKSARERRKVSRGVSKSALSPPFVIEGNETAHTAPVLPFASRKEAIMAATARSTRSKSQEIISDQQLLAGLQKHLPNTTFIIQAVPETTAEVESVIQVRVDKALAVITARTALHAAVLASLQEDEGSNAFVQDVRQTVRTMYSTSPLILADFGLTDRKPRTPLTPAQKLVAAAKGQATRAARGTMSAKKKATIVGTVTGTIVVPVDGSATSIVSSPAAVPVPAPQPAAPAITNGSSTPHS